MVQVWNAYTQSYQFCHSILLYLLSCLDYPLPKLNCLPETL